MMHQLTRRNPVKLNCVDSYVNMKSPPAIRKTMRNKI